VSRSTRQVLPWLALVSVGWCRADGDAPIARVEARLVGSVGPRVVLAVADLPAWGAGGRLVVACDGEALGWFEEAGTREGRPVFVSRQAVETDLAGGRLLAWVVGPDCVAHFRGAWPLDAQLWARIDTVGLGDQSVWIDAGSHQAVQVGDCWWYRVAGQPVARYDVRLVGSSISYCRVVPLVAGLRPRPGEMVSLWPAPGLRDTGRAVSAVSFVEAREDGQVVWVAAPPATVNTPAEPRVDFRRAGDYIGGGVVERQDARFWYVRTLPGACAGDVHVGDDALIRTVADIRNRRISARVFELTSAGALINGGEIDGLSVGDVAAVYRAGNRIGQVRLTRVQRVYSVAQLTEDAERPDASQPTQSSEPQPHAKIGGLQRLDEVHFGRPPPAPVTLGVIERVVDRTLFSAQLAKGSGPPLLTPLVLRRADQTIGVAVLLDATDGRAVGLALARSLAELPAAGDELSLSP
jgi:hypothetical protein